MKKYLVSVLAVLCAAVLVFVACSANTADDGAEPVNAPAATATPEPTQTPAPTAEPAEHAENQGSNAGQGEGEDLSSMIDDSAKETETPSGSETEQSGNDEVESGQWQVGDTVLNPDGSVMEIVDFDKMAEEVWSNITPEELQELRDMQITFN